jgi:ferredoxin
MEKNLKVIEFPSNNEGQSLSLRQRSFLRANLRAAFKGRSGIDIDYSKCDFCRKCMGVCPQFLFSLREDDSVFVCDQAISFCPGTWNCGDCVEVCSAEAITIIKENEHILALA